MMARVGIDFGVQDAAVVVVEPALPEDVYSFPVEPVFHVRFCEMVPMSDLRRGLDRVEEIVRRARARVSGWVEVYADASSLGRYGVELVRQRLWEIKGAYLSEIEIVAAGGSEQGNRVSRTALLLNLATLVRNGRVIMPEGVFPELVAQLRALQIRVSNARRLHVEPVEAEDDLAVALALCVWRPVPADALVGPPIKRTVREPI